MKYLKNKFALDLSKVTVKKAVHSILILSIIFNLFMLIFYDTITYRIYFHSDAAAVNLMADEIFRTGELFPKDWNYPNGDLWAFFGHLFILPLLFILDNGFALHAFSAIISASLVISSVWLLLKELEITITGRLLFLAIFTSGISTFFTEQVFGQLAYGTILYLLLFQLFFLIRFLKNYSNGNIEASKISLLAFNIIIFLIFVSNPGRAIATNIAPIAISLLFVFSKYYYQGDGITFKLEKKGVLLILYTSIFSGLAGIIVYLLILTNANTVYGAANAVYLDYTNMIHHFLGFFNGWLNLFGGQPTAGRSVLSAVGIYEAWHLAFALILLVFPFYLVKIMKHESSLYLLLMILFTLVNLSIVLFFYIFTSVADMSTPSAVIQSSRYLLVSAFLVFLLFFIMLDRWIHFSNYRFGYLFFIFLYIPFLSSGYFIYLLPVLGSEVKDKVSNYDFKISSYDPIVELLKKHNLDYGFSSYWNANVTTVLSENQIKIRSIHVRGLPMPMRHLSSNAWYRANAYNGSTFFLFSEEEYALVDWPLMEEYLGKPAREFTDGSWQIVVYSFNVASKLPGWDDMITEPRKFILTKKSFHQIGQFMEKDNKSWLEAVKGEVGFLAYGPYVNLGSGKYEALFNIWTDDVDEITAIPGTVDVACDGVALIAKDISMKKGKQKITLPFEVIGKNGRCEFRVFSRGITTLKSKAIIASRVK